MTHKSSLDNSAIAAMILLCAMWGFQQVAIKVAIPEIAPLWQSGARSMGATIVIGLWILLARVRWTPGLAVPGIAVGSLFAIEFGLLYFALHYTDAARATLLLYTAPFVVAVGGHFLIEGERLSPAGWLGVALAFAGTAFVMQASFDLNSTRMIGDFCALLAGICWGATTVMIRKTGLATAAPAQTLFYQLLISGIGLCAAAWIFEGNLTLPQSVIGWSSILYQMVAVAALSYLAWFALITRYSATKLSVFTFLAPIFGALAGIIFLGETLDSHHIIALLLTCIGIVIVNLYGHGKNQSIATAVKVQESS